MATIKQLKAILRAHKKEHKVNYANLKKPELLALINKLNLGHLIPGKTSKDSKGGCDSCGKVITLDKPIQLDAKVGFKVLDKVLKKIENHDVKPGDSIDITKIVNDTVKETKGKGGKLLKQPPLLQQEPLIDYYVPGEIKQPKPLYKGGINQNIDQPVLAYGSEYDKLMNVKPYYGEGVNWGELFNKGVKAFEKGKEVYEKSKPYVEKGIEAYKTGKQAYDIIKPAYEVLRDPNLSKGEKAKQLLESGKELQSVIQPAYEKYLKMTKGGTKRYRKRKSNGGEGIDPISAVANAVGSVVGAAPDLIAKAQAANDNRLANQLKQRVEWRKQRLLDDFIPYFDRLGQKGELENNSMSHNWSKYQDGNNKYNTMQQAYDAEGLPGILNILVRIAQWQIPLGPDSLVRANWDRPFF